jgi:hypothetical protein
VGTVVDVVVVVVDVVVVDVVVVDVVDEFEVLPVADVTAVPEERLWAADSNALSAALGFPLESTRP